MSPLLFFLSVVLITVVAVGAYAIVDARRRRRLRALGEEFGMHFAAGDRFDLARTVAGRFPVAGPADALVTDLLYCRRNQRYVYVFRFDYTIGVTGPKLRRRAIVGFTEPCSAEAGERSPLTIAQPGGVVVEQYRSLVERLREELPAAGGQ